MRRAPSWVKALAILFVYVSIGLMGCAVVCALLRYAMLPNVTWEDEVSLTFSTVCPETKRFANNMCDFPSAEVLLVNEDIPALTRGHPYTCTAELHIPDSPRNHAAGVSILTLDLLDVNRTLVAQFRKSFAVPYRSTLVRLANRLLVMPLYLTHMIEEELHVVVKLALRYKDPGITRYGRLTLETRDLVWSRAQLRFHAQLSGLRSWMYYWPRSSFLIMLGFFFMIAIIIHLAVLIYVYRPKRRNE